MYHLRVLRFLRRLRCRDFFPRGRLCSLGNGWRCGIGFTADLRRNQGHACCSGQRRTLRFQGEKWLLDKVIATTGNGYRDKDISGYEHGGTQARNSIRDADGDVGCERVVEVQRIGDSAKINDGA